VLCARADIAPPGLEEALASKGWTTTRVIAYRTQLAEQLPRAAIDALERGDVDVVTFTSVSTVAGFARAVGAEPYAIPLCVCIGPVTAAEARRRGYPIGAVATEHTSEGLVAAVELAHVRRLNR
jgi:uroporphyrinogen III methyltransferase/synthase